MSRNLKHTFVLPRLNVIATCLALFGFSLTTQATTYDVQKDYMTLGGSKNGSTVTFVDVTSVVGENDVWNNSGNVFVGLVDGDNGLFIYGTVNNRGTWIVKGVENTDDPGYADTMDKITGTFNNYGRMELYGGNTVASSDAVDQLHGQLNNYGTLIVKGGLSGSVNNGISTIFDGAELNNYATMNILTGVGDRNNGLAIINQGGVLHNHESAELNLIVGKTGNQSAAIREIHGEIINDGSFKATYEENSESPTVAIYSLTETGKFTNNGTAIFTGGYTAYADAFEYIYGTLTNNGTFYAKGGSALSTQGLDRIYGTVINNGTFNAIGGSEKEATGIASLFSGATIINNNVMNISGGVGEGAYGFIAIANGANFENSKGAILTIAGGSGWGADGLRHFEGTLTNNGTLKLIGGSFDQGDGMDNIGLNASLLNDTDATLVIIGNAGNGIHAIVGDLTNKGNISISTQGPAAGIDYINGTLLNEKGGQITVSGLGNGTFGINSFEPSIKEGGNITNKGTLVLNQNAINDTAEVDIRNSGDLYLNSKLNFQGMISQTDGSFNTNFDTFFNHKDEQIGLNIIGINATIPEEVKTVLTDLFRDFGIPELTQEVIDHTTFSGGKVVLHLPVNFGTDFLETATKTFKETF